MRVLVAGSTLVRFGGEWRRVQPNEDGIISPPTLIAEGADVDKEASRFTDKPQPMMVLRGHEIPVTAEDEAKFLADGVPAHWLQNRPDPPQPRTRILVPAPPSLNDVLAANAALETRVAELEARATL